MSVEVSGTYPINAEVILLSDDVGLRLSAE